MRTSGLVKENSPRSDEPRQGRADGRADLARKAILIAGPTASGKSALALAIATAFGGTVINGDSMQVYDLLRVITARPGPEDEAQAPHRLYGVLPPSQACSMGLWRQMAEAALDETWGQGRVPVVVGGTGLYLRSLIQGLSPIPDIPDPVRARCRAQFAEMGNEAFHRLLAQRDPEMAARLHPGNSQRLVRALEVIEATGRSLAWWQEQPHEGRVEADWLTMVIEPPREQLYAACDARLVRMVREMGALEEVRALAALELDPALPATKALGVPELTAHLRGVVDLDQAIANAQQATRNYAKRQLTWFRHQIDARIRLPAQFSERMWQEIFPIVRRFLLTKAD